VEGKAPADPIVVMETLSSEYGWTPEEIRQQPIHEVHAYMEIIRIRRALQKYAQQ